MADVELAEPAQLPPHVVQVQHPGLVDPQPHVGRQPGDRVVAAAGANLRHGDSSSRHPANSCSTSASTGGTRSCGRPKRAAGSSHPAGTRSRGRSGCAARSCAAAPGTGSTPSRGRPRGARRRTRIAQHPSEVGVRVAWLHLPQRPVRTRPGSAAGGRSLADGAVGQPRRGPRQRKAGQHIGLEVSEIFLAHRCPVITQVGSRPEPTRAPQLRQECRTVPSDERIS